MALPDISALTPDEVAQLNALTAQRLAELQQTEEQMRSALLSDSVIDTEISKMLGVVADSRIITDTTKSTINADPAAYIKDLARMLRPIARDVNRLLRVVGERLDSADIGTE